MLDEYTCAVRRSSPVHNGDTVIDKPGPMHVQVVEEVEREGKRKGGRKKRERKKETQEMDNIATNYTSRSLTSRLFTARLVTGPRVYHVVHDRVLFLDAVEIQFLRQFLPRAYHLPVDDVVSHRPRDPRAKLLPFFKDAYFFRKLIYEVS